MPNRQRVARVAVTIALLSCVEMLPAGEVDPISTVGSVTLEAIGASPPGSHRVVATDDTETSVPTIEFADHVEQSSLQRASDELHDAGEVIPVGGSAAATVSSCSDDCDCEDCVDRERSVVVEFGDWLGYNAAQSSTTWVAGGDFEMLSFESFPTLELEDESAIVFGTGFHFLSGPTTAADLPPRVFDFQAAFHSRKPLSETTTLDVKLGVGAFGDFDTSVRKGIRFPGHVVSHTQWSCDLASVFGVEILDRDDVSVLPVAGLIWRPVDDLIFDLVFPRPRVQLRLSDETTMFVAGELGGSTWAVRRADGIRDNATYRDLRVTWGFSDSSDGSDTAFEIGFAFDRELEYRSRRGDTEFDGAFVMRYQTRY